MAIKSKPPIFTYTERLPQVRRVFDLYCDRVEIHAQWTAGNAYHNTVKLADLTGEFTRVVIRNRWFKKSVMIGSIALAAAAVLPHGDYPQFVRSAALLGWPLAGVCIAIAAISFPKRQFARFTRRDGKVGLDLCNAGPNKARYQEFIREIQRRIRKA